MRFLALVLILLIASSAFAVRQTTGRNAFDQNFNLDVAIGNEKRVHPDFILGFSVPITAATGEVTIWDNDFTVTPLDAPEELFINSTSAADVGTVVGVSGLDENYDSTFVVAVLNGLTPVSLGTLGHVQLASVLDFSSEPAGDVYIARSSTLTAGVPLDADVLSRIPQGDNITHNAWFRVPRGSFAVVMALKMSTSDPNGATITVVRKSFGASFTVMAQRFHTVPGLQEATFPAPAGTAFIAGSIVAIRDEKSYVEFRAEVNTNGQGQTVYLAQDIFIIDKDYIGLQ